MAIKFQYNKTSLNELNKQLKVRTRALPTLKNKESALRLEVKKAKQRSDALLEQLAASLKEFEFLAGLWNEFEPGLISIQDVELETVKLAGVKIPELKEVKYEVKEFDYFRKPLWYSEGVKILKDLALESLDQCAIAYLGSNCSTQLKHFALSHSDLPNQLRYHRFSLDNR